MVLGRLFFAVAIIAVSYFVGGAHSATPVADPVLSQYFVEPKTDDTMLRVAHQFEVVRREGNGFVVIVPAQRADELLKLVPTAKLQMADIRDEINALKNKKGDILGYRSFDEVQEHLVELQEMYPDIVELQTYGYSQGNRPLYALKISDNVSVDEDEPKLMLTAATHGDELITVEVLLGLIDQIVQGYGEDDRFTAFVEQTQLFFLPVINPDGFVRQSRYANGVDPNREYPWPDRPERSPVECIAGLIDFFHSHDFAGTMDFHAHGRMIMYPWAYTYDRVNTEDDVRMDAMTTAMARHNGYVHGPISEVIYVARGSSADYYYWQNQSDAIAIEIGYSKVPPAPQIPNMITENSESTWTWISEYVE